MKLPKLFTNVFARMAFGGLAFNETLLANIDRENVRFLLPEDSRFYVTEWTRHQINEKTEWLWQNFACVKDMAATIARHTIGKGISIQLETDDEEWNALAENDFEAWAVTPDRCDIAGRRNFYEAQDTAIQQWTVRGEFCAAHVQNPRWKSPLPGGTDAPAFWLIDTNDVRTPANLANPLLLKSVVDGVQLGDYGEPVSYYVRTSGQFTFQEVPAGDFMHFFKPHAINQVRGISPLAQAINPLVDIHELKRLTTRSAKAQQMVTMVLKNMSKQTGRGAMGAISAGGPKQSDGAQYQEVEQMGRKAGAGIAYVDSEGDVKMVSSNAPSPLVEPFIRDLLMRDACLAPGLPMEFFWDPTKLSGANTRFILGRADLLFQVLADALIYRFCTPVAIRLLSWRMENGLLPKCKDPRWMDKVGWQLPARLTVDVGREGALDIAKLKSGMLNLRAYYNSRGMNWRTELQQRIREMAEMKKMCDDAKMPELFQYFVALDPGATLIKSESDKKAAETDSNPDAEDDDPEASGDPEKKAAA